MPDDKGNGAKERKDDEGKESRAGLRTAFGHAEKRFQGARVAGVFKRLVGEGFHIGHSLHGFLDHRAGIGQRVLRVLRVSAHLAAEKRNGQHHHRHASQHDEREFPRGNENKDQAADENHALPDRLRHGVEQGVADHSEIGGNAVAQRPGTLLVEERHRQPHQMIEKIAAQAVERGLAGADESLDAEKSDKSLQHQHPGELHDDQVRARQHFGRIDLLFKGIHRISHQLFEKIRKAQRKDGCEKQGRQRGEKDRFFLHQIAQNPPVGRDGFLQARFGHARMGDYQRRYVNRA